jgi:ribosomal protein S19E (S16A)
MATSEQLREKILSYLAKTGQGMGSGPIFSIKDAHANIMKELYPSEEGLSPRTFSNRALFDEALDQLLAEGFVEKREDGRYFLTEKGHQRAA